MFTLLLFILAIYFLFIYWPVALALFATVIVIAIVLRKKRSESACEPFEEKSTPKVGAAVSQDKYDKIHSYCKRHNITISDLIRNAVDEYMKLNP